MQDEIIRVQEFREALHNLFPKRADSIMNLLDALASHGNKCRSVVQLSNANCFDRQYSSVTDAIADGLPHANFQVISKLVFAYAGADTKQGPYRFIVDCTPNPRQYAKSLADRHITHAPNPAPGNKPICVGHQYSVLAMLPNNALSQTKRWLIPISTQRVRSDKKGNETGMEQITDNIDFLDLKNELCISIGDTLYGTEQCRVAAKKTDNLVHIFRLNGKRNLYSQPEKLPSETLQKGRSKEFGIKINLGNSGTHPTHDKYEEIPWTNCKGKAFTVRIKCWDDMLLRGSKKYRSAKDPMNLIQITLINEQGEEVYKRPLWLSVFGSRRHEISLVDAYQNYKSRYDIEHYFRFGKQNLLMDSYQTPDAEHEELWWQLCMLAYTQLFLAKENIANSIEPWERYLPTYKNTTNSTQTMITPSQAQRGFAALLKTIDTPAKPCVARGKSSGRIASATQVKRELMEVIFKSKNIHQSNSKTILKEFEAIDNIPNPQRIIDLVSLVHASLKKLNVSPSEFFNLLSNST